MCYSSELKPGNFLKDAQTQGPRNGSIRAKESYCTSNISIKFEINTKRLILTVPDLTDRDATACLHWYSSDMPILSMVSHLTQYGISLEHRCVISLEHRCVETKYTNEKKKKIHSPEWIKS